MGLIIPMKVGLGEVTPDLSLKGGGEKGGGEVKIFFNLLQRGLDGMVSVLQAEQWK